MGAAVAVALLCPAGASAQSIGELAAFSDARGCVAAREFSDGKPGRTSVPNCAGMRRQRWVSDLVASPDVKRLYAVDAPSESVVAYGTLAAGGLRELAGEGSCAPLSGAPVPCRLTEGSGGRDARDAGRAAISPDGRFLYVGSTVGGRRQTGVPGSPSTVVVDVIRAAGGLAWLGCVSDDGTNGRGEAVCSPMRGVDGVGRLEVGPDGRNLYVVTDRYRDDPDADPPDEGIAVFERNAETGSLRQLDGPAGCVTRSGAGGGCTAEPSLAGLTDFVLSPSGRSAYATSIGAGQARGGAFALKRDPATGALEPARGPGTCVGDFATRVDCTADGDVTLSETASLSPDGRFLYTSGLGGMVVLAVDDAGPALSRAGCVSNGFPRACTRILIDPGEGARMTFTADGRTALLQTLTEVESLRRDPETGALSSRGCIAAEESATCSWPVTDLAVSNLAIAPGGGTVYAGEGRAIYALAPGAAPRPPRVTPLAADGTVSVPVRCDAPPTRHCRGTLQLTDFDERLPIPRVPLSVDSGRTEAVRVPVPAAVRRAIVRRRRVTFSATTRIGAPERRTLVAERDIRVEANRAARPPGCRRGGVRTLVRTSRARIYTVRTPLGPDVHETTYACLFSAGRQVRLDEPDLYGAEEPFRIVGPLLAYVYELAAEGPSDATTYVRVVDLRSGRERRRLCAFGPDACASADGAHADVRTIVMLPSGGVAWTAGTGGDHVVVKADAGRPPRVLDEAVGRIRLASLRLEGNRLTWKHRDRTRSATLR